MARSLGIPTRIERAHTPFGTVVGHGGDDLGSSPAAPGQEQHELRHTMRTRTTSLLLAATLSAAPMLLAAQLNGPGRVHVAVGLAAGAHGTEYTETGTVLGIALSRKTLDGAATVTVPIEVGVGVADFLSLGLYVEPGSYLDSSATESNGLAMVGFQPRFYLVNKDRFAWMASLRLGGSALQIDREEPFIRTEARYRGGHFGLGTGVAFHFSDLIGLQLHANYLTNRLTLQDYRVNGSEIPLDLYEAELLTRGVALQASLAFRF